MGRSRSEDIARGFAMKEKCFICLAGIDGSGKTTISKKILGVLGNDYNYIWARWEPFFLRPFVSIVNLKSSKKRLSDTSTHKYRKRIKKRILGNPLVKKLWLVGAEFDYFIQLIFKVSFICISGKSILCDRYIYDFYVDQLINLGEKPNQMGRYLNKRILRLFPKPDLLFHIRISPKTGHERKKDGTSIVYLSERREYYDELKKIYNTIEINGENHIDKVSQDIIDNLNRQMRDSLE